MLIIMTDSANQADANRHVGLPPQSARSCVGDVQLRGDLTVSLASHVQQVNRPCRLFRGVGEFIHARLVIPHSLLKSKSLVGCLSLRRLDRFGTGKSETASPSELVDDSGPDNLAHHRIVWSRLVISPAPPDVLPRFLKGILCQAEIPTGLAASKGKEAIPVGTPPALELCLGVRWLHPLALPQPIHPSTEKRKAATEFESAVSFFSDFTRLTSRKAQ
jgi:hypothetical protein